MRTKEVMNSIKNQSNKIKYTAIVGVALLIAVDANAAWDLSKQIGDSIITPVAKAFKDWVSVIIGIAAGGGLALGTQGDLRERSKVAGIGFLGGYGVIEVIKAMSGI
ncbi:MULTISPECIES: hypothetical protein [spotted fever group]|uniref:Uncharacterized protein n=1 Tax=Rickettsia tamurae subsp. buchneri TaxID=1462938 RepID=A0A8E0WKF3_9RICK|nr:MULTISPECIES: hypothetical protein [spotted fever group]KDO02139.1 hypothetical protein REISMN_08780 [Rickettsia tamurae subsp. buchneri]